MSYFSAVTWPHPLTHPYTQPPIHAPIGGGVSTNHKSLNRIELYQLCQDLFDIYPIIWIKSDNFLIEPSTVEQFEMYPNML